MTSTALPVPLSALTPARDTAEGVGPRGSTERLEARDEALFLLAAKGDREALGELIERYKDFLFGLLVRLSSGDEHRAEDFFQDTFVNAMRASATFDSKKAFKPWITAIAVNLVRDDARKRKVRSEITLEGNGAESEGERTRIEPVAQSEDPSAAAERRDEEDKVRRALDRLTALEREVVLLHFFNNMTLQETATSLSAPLGTIKSRLHAALTRLSGFLTRV